MAVLPQVQREEWQLPPVAEPQAVEVVVVPEMWFTGKYILKLDKAPVPMSIMMQVIAVLIRELGKYGK